MSGTDTTAGYLGAKIVGGTNVTLTTLLPTGNSQIQINVPIDASVVTFTPSTPANWNGGIDPGNTNNALDQLASRAKALENHSGELLTSNTDVTYNYLAGKLVAGTNITLTTIGTTDKKVQIDSTGGGGGGTDNNAQEMAWLRSGFDDVVTANWLADGQLTNSSADLYTVGVGQSTRITSILLNNVAGGDNETVILSMYDGVNTLVFAYVTLTQGATFTFVPDSPLIMSAGMIIKGESQSIGGVDYWISGGERTDPITGIKPIVIYSGQPNTGDPLYTVPVGKTIIISYISNSISTDPGAPGGSNFDLEATSVTHATVRQLYNICQKYQTTQYLYPGIMMHDGDTLTGGNESSQGDLIICGWIG